MKSVSLVFILAFFFSEVASATTCDLLDGAYVEASDGTYLGFFGASSSSESIANSSGLYGSSSGVNSVRNSSVCMVQPLASTVPIIVFLSIRQRFIQRGAVLSISLYAYTSKFASGGG